MTEESGCFFLCSSRHVCTKKAYEDILPRGLLGSPLPMVTDGVYLAGSGAVGGRWRGSASRPNTRPPPLARKAADARLPRQPAPGGRLRAHASSRHPPARPRPGASRAITTPLPKARDASTRRPPSARAEEGNAAGAVETLFLAEMFPRLPRRRPHSKSCRLTTDIQKTTETGPGRASRPPAGPGRPPSTAPGPHPPSAPIPLAGSNPGSHSAQPGQKAMRKGGTADPRTRRG